MCCPGHASDRSDWFQDLAATVVTAANGNYKTELKARLSTCPRVVGTRGPFRDMESVKLRRISILVDERRWIGRSLRACLIRFVVPICAASRIAVAE